MALNKDEIAAWTDEIIQCRSGGHWWDSRRDAKQIQGGFQEGFNCARRCGTSKRLIYDNLGQIVATYYSYPPGYQRRGKGSLDARDRGQLRLAAKNLAKL
jgi:hypothetical protein